MGRLTKVFAWIIVALVALFAVAVIALLLLFEPGDFRDQIAEAVKESTGRELTIEGEVSLEIFPWLAIEVGKTRMGNAPGFGDEPFAEFERTRFSVRLLPLLFGGETAIGTAELDGLRLNLAVDRQGRNNWDDLSADTTTKTEAPTEIPEVRHGGFSLSGVVINDAAISYTDRQAGSDFALTGASLVIGPVAEDPGDGVVAIGKIDFEAMAEGLAAQPTRIAFATGGIELQTNEQQVTIEPLRLEALGIEIRAEFEPFSYADAVEPRATIRVETFSPRSVMTVMGTEPPETADPSALSEVSVEAVAVMGEKAIELTNLVLRLDDTTLRGGLSVPTGAAGSMAFDLQADRIDLDRYMAPATEADAVPDESDAAPVEIPVDLIRPLNLRGKMGVATVGFGGLQLDNVAVGVNAAGGKLRLHPISANLYGGKYSGDVRVDVSGAVPVLSLNETIEGVNLEKLAMAMFEQKNISGAIKGNFRLTGRGADTAAIQRTLAGNLSFELRDGAYEGVDVWYELRRARALLRNEAPPSPKLPARTPFTTVTATGVVQEGVMRNDDFAAELPFIRLTGKGSVDIAAATVDYALRARVLEKPDAMQGVTPEEIEDFTKVVVPVKITGQLSSPKVSPDVEDLLREQVEEQLKEKLQDKLKDLFDR